MHLVVETSPPTDYSVQGLEKEVADFNALYRDVSFGDVYNLCYNNQTATSTLSLNGRVIGSTTGADFSVALFSVWYAPIYRYWKVVNLKASMFSGLGRFVSWSDLSGICLRRSSNK